MADTTHLLLPLMAAAQAQKHVTHNEAILRLDALVQMSVKDRGLIEPPADPSDGDRYIPASGATGAWATWDLNVAWFVDGVWTKLTPREGWRVLVDDEDVLLVWDGAAWVEIQAGGGSGSAGGAVNAANYQSAATQSIPNSTFTTITDWAAVDDDKGAGISYAAGVWTVAAGASGWFMVTASFGVAGGAPDTIVRIVKNGSTVVADARVDTGGSTNLTKRIFCATAVKLAADDTIEVVGWHNRGSSVVSTGATTTFSLARLGSVIA
jgi:hypothetical protein